MRRRQYFFYYFYYYILCRFFFLFPPEFIHQFVIKLLKLAFRLKLFSLSSREKHFSAPCVCMGLNFLNPVGLAAGFDKNGEAIEALAALGFGYIEVGTVTPRAQNGNQKPRLFRLIKENALINRLGFNNQGIDRLVANIQKIKKQNRRKIIIGVNIGKNKETAIENAVTDYLICFQKAAPVADYVTMNISSPNTEKLRELQQSDYLENLLSCLKAQQQAFLEQSKKYVPIVMKISPDLSEDAIKTMAACFIKYKIDGVIATNTTVNKVSLKNIKDAKKEGGLSGWPLKNQSTLVLQHFQKLLKESNISLIGCGGIFNASDAKEKIAAGANLLQIYTGLIFVGPACIKEVFASFRRENK